MTQSKILKTAARLYEAGWAIHWVRPKAKNPVESGWTTGPRKSWEYLLKTFVEGYNVGVRTGLASKIGDNYLACIDVDVKDPSARKAAYLKLKELVPNLIDYPQVQSGSGQGSMHLYCVTRSPFKMITFAKESGFEICIYSDGRQMVLPPSVHPNGSTYEWGVKTGGQKLPLRDFSKVESVKKSTSSISNDINKKPISNDISLVKVEGFDLLEISDAVREGITKGTNVSDRSAYLLPAATALYSAGLNTNEILSVLTDRAHFIGACAFDHAKTDDRHRAAEWLYKYTVKKVISERDPVEVFKNTPIAPAKRLSDEEIAVQNADFEAEADWRNDLQKSQKGKYVDSLHNVHLILTKCFGDKLFRFNDFAKIDEVWGVTPWGSEVGSEFKERDVHRMRLWFSHQWGFEPSEGQVLAAMIVIADNNIYHPVREYLNALPKHDGVMRVDSFLKKYLNGDGPDKYLSAVSRKTLVAMVARVFEPGRKFDTMLVIEGNQGFRKSTAVMVLAGKKWFSDVNLNLKHKDSIADISGKWVIEQGEMNVMSKHDVKELKQFLSRDTDRMRPSYGRKSQDYPRQMIFIGTTNEDIYLKDTTGSRRFWPVKISKNCDVAAIARDRDQIFAEALAMYKTGEPLWIDDRDTEHLAHLEREGREVNDELTHVISDWIEKREKDSNFDDNFDPSEIPLLPLFGLEGPLNSPAFRHLQADMNGQKRVADCLRKLGYERKILFRQGKNQKLWVKLPVRDNSITRRGSENEQ